jgi:hypothetical protein
MRRPGSQLSPARRTGLLATSSGCLISLVGLPDLLGGSTWPGDRGEVLRLTLCGVVGLLLGGGPRRLGRLIQGWAVHLMVRGSGLLVPVIVCLLVARPQPRENGRIMLSRAGRPLRRGLLLVARRRGLLRVRRLLGRGLLEQRYSSSTGHATQRRGRLPEDQKRAPDCSGTPSDLPVLVGTAGLEPATP